MDSLIRVKWQCFIGVEVVMIKSDAIYQYFDFFQMQLKGL